MRAVVLDQHGDPGVLRVAEVADPQPREGEILVELDYAGLNRRDALVRAGIGPGYRPPLPAILGADGVGRRRDTGEEVIVFPALRWGDRDDMPGPDYTTLGGGRNGGTYAELVAIPEENAIARPPWLSGPEAATFALSGVTAYRALITVGKLQARQKVVVLGAGSGVSLTAIQIAKQVGAEVAVTSSSGDKIKLAKELGASTGILYTQRDWDTELRDEFGEADLVLDSVGATLQESVLLLRRGGAVVTMGGTGNGGQVSLDVRTIYLTHKRILGTAMGSPRDFAKFVQLAEAARLDPIVDSVYDLDDVVAAHEALDSHDRFGKIALQIR